jgi:hypothetical protein
LKIAANMLLGMAKDIINHKLMLFGVGNSLKKWFAKDPNLMMSEWINSSTQKKIDE